MNTVTATTELASTELTTTETTTSELSSDELYSIDIDKLGQDKSNTDKLSTEKVLSSVKFAGAGTVVAAMALFLFEGISVNNDIQRFITILGFGALLSGAGLIVNKWLSDRVASRLFIGLSLISVPVIACVLGGLIYSLTPAAQSADYPMFATWTLADSASLWVAVPLGLGVVSAISALATMIMVRSEVRWMTPALLISTSLLLVPIRDSSVIALLVLFSFIALVWAVRKYQVNPISFQTSEGRFALGVLFLAPVIMIGRTLALYQPDYFMAVCISGMLYGVLRRMYFRTEAGVKPETALLVATAATGFTALTSVVGYAHDVISNHFRRAFVKSDGLLLTDSTFSFLVQLLTPLWALMILLVMFDLLKKRKNWFLPSLHCGDYHGELDDRGAEFHPITALDYRIWSNNDACRLYVTPLCSGKVLRSWHTDAGHWNNLYCTRAVVHPSTI